MKGPTYVGKGDLESYSKVILNYDRENELAVTSIKKSPESIVIYLENQSSFLATLLSFRPKRIIWSFIQNGDSVVISNEIFLHFRYILIFLLSCSIWPVLLKFALDISEPMPLLSVFAVLSSFGLLFFSYFLLLGESGRRIHVIFEALQSAAKAKNEVLIKSSSPTLSLHARHLLFFLAYVCMMVWFVFVRDNASFSQLFVTYRFLTFLLIPCGLLIASLMIIPIGGVSLRLGPMLPGFVILVGTLFLSVVFWLWKIPSETFDHEKLNFLATASTVLNDPDSSGLSPKSIAELTELINKLRQIAMSSFLVWFAIIGLGIYFIVDGVRLTQLVVPGSSRLSRYSGNHIAIARAASGSGFLTVFRLFFGGAWLSMGALILYGITNNGMAFISALVGAEQLGFLPTSQWIHVSQQLLTLAVTGKFESPIVFAFIRIGWLLGCGLSVVIVGISICQLIFQRRRQYRGLLQRTNKGDCDSKVVIDIASLISLEPPQICIKDTKDINAWAYEFGLFGRKRFVEITSGAIAQEQLTPGFLRFVIGHELSHLRLGHVRWLNWLRWFGRLTLVGDTFVLTLINSWDCEEAADLYVLHKTNIPRYEILGCLEILQMQNIVRSKTNNTMSIYTENNLEGAVGLDRTSNYRWKNYYSIRVFIDQYINPFSHSYWHPDIISRIEAISMQKRQKRRTSELSGTKKARFSK